MTKPADHTYDRDDLALLLAPRQAEVMRLFWSHGPATVREIRQRLASDDIPAYTTVATICVRLAERGLLQQRMEEAGCDNRQAYVYTPSISEADFVRMAVEQQLDGLLAHYPDLVCAYVTPRVQRAGAGGPGGGMDDRAPESNVECQGDHDRIEMRNSKLETQNSELVAALTKRAEVAERQAAAWEGEARRAQQGEQIATARLERAEARAMQWEAAAHRATAQAQAAEEDASVVIRRVELQQHGATRSASEHYDPAGVCRVCNAPVADAPARRRDGLRVCAGEACQQEAQRRDHAAKQRGLRARRRIEREHERALAR
jgi:predicted transcriptional regulator